MADLLIARPPAVRLRLGSLDVLRGLVVAFMVVVENQGSGAHAFPGTAHAPWNGLTPADLVLPSFLFIVGASLAMAIERCSWVRIARRVVVLFALGLLLTDLRPPGVLQHIALCYLLVACAVKVLSTRQQWFMAAVVLVWAGFSPAEQPLGLATVPTEALNVLAGYWAARWLRVQPAWRRAAGRLAYVGVACLATGLAWSSVLPLNKRLWTGSFAVVTTGVAVLLLAGAYLVVDVYERRRFAWAFEVFGRNAILLYVASELVSDWLKHTGWRQWLYQHVFVPWGGLHAGSLAYALAFVGLWWLALASLYRRRIFVRA